VLARTGGVVRAPPSMCRRGGTVASVSAPEPRPIRIGNAEGEQAVRALGDHFAQGRLEPHEFEERMTAAYAARTAPDLDALFADLPGAHQHRTVHQPTLSYPEPLTPSRGVPPAIVPYPTGHDPQAPFGREPVTGLPYSDRSRSVAGLLQLLLPFGVGRFYSGHAAVGVAQLLLSVFLIGVVWSFLDGIVILAGRPLDPYGRPLRP
jgi:Domain of unknown function (DUF1707)/TM2 domain